MSKFLLKKSDGWVYPYSEVLARRDDMQEFEYDGQPPDQIKDLTAFLVGNNAEAPRPRRGRPAAQPE